MRRILAVLLVLLMAFCLIACGAQKDTTLTGMVTSIDGTFLEGEAFQQREEEEMPELPEGEMLYRPENGERPKMPTGENGGMGGFGGRGNKPTEGSDTDMQ